MKTPQLSDVRIRSAISAAVVAVFVLLALGSIDDYLIEASTELDSEILDDGREKNSYKTKYSKDQAVIKSFTGTQDPQGRWEGPVEIVHQEWKGISWETTHVETVNMVEGQRHGTGVTTFTNGRQPETIEWDHGRRIAEEGSAKALFEAQSTYELLSFEFPWYIYWMNNFGYDDTDIQTYVDSLELLTFANELNSLDDLEDAYSDAVDALLEAGSVDSIGRAANILYLLLGRAEVLNAEFWLAVIDQHLENDRSTLEIIEDKYPGYLDMMESFEVTGSAFERFCRTFDSIMYTYPALDQSDPFYGDSIETRMYYTLSSFSDEDYGSPENADVASSVIMTILYYYSYGDRIYDCMTLVYYARNEIVTLPVLTTNFVGKVSTGNAEVRGSVINDGGGEITSTGIAWSGHFNPTTEDQTVSGGSITGSFSLTLEGLAEDQTYYARSYASNSAGTAYGNNIEFTLSEIQVSAFTREENHDFSIYPNPAQYTARMRVRLTGTRQLTLNIYDLKGQLADMAFNGILTEGWQEIEFDVSGLPPAPYICRLSSEDGEMYVETLLISR